MSATTSTLDPLAGRYRLWPGRSLPIEGGRPVVGPAVLQGLARGRSAELLPGLLGSVFTLCGQAHRIAAGSALRAAQGDLAPLGGALRLRLHAETAREHLQRMALDWPQRLGTPGAAMPPPTWLVGCPLLTHADQPAEALAGLAPWLVQHLLGQPADTWLAAWQAEGETALRRWAQQQAGRHPVAALLHRLAAQPLPTGSRPWRPWPARDGDVPAQAMAELAQAMQSPDFIHRPLCQGQPAETGPWTRRRQDGAAHNAWMRLASRLVDLVQLALWDGTDATAPLAHGGLGTGPREGIAWVEMARGLLVHWVRLDERQRVDDLRVLAPTEWNLHPQGLLAQALAALPAGDPDTPAMARLLATAFDPCVAFDLGLPETCDA